MSLSPVFSKALRVLIITTSLLSSQMVQGQEVDHQFWMNYTLKIPVSEKLSWGGDLGVRGLGSNRDWNQILIRPAVSYRFNRSVSIAGAMAWFGTLNNGDYNISEYRIHQDFNFKWPDLGIVAFFYRVRIEERFFFYQSDIDNAFKVRLRALVGMETADITLLSSKRPIYFQVLFEGFRTADKEEAVEVFINQSRLHFALGHRVLPNFRYELHYIAQRSRLFNEDGTQSAQNLYRIRLFHSLKGKK